jgi:hypothetical protein
VAKVEYTNDFAFIVVQKSKSLKQTSQNNTVALHRYPHSGLGLSLFFQAFLIRRAYAAPLKKSLPEPQVYLDLFRISTINILINK